jgi:phosphocarrier protein
MSIRIVTVGSTVGLHARPAALIAERAGELGSEVLVGLPGQEPVDANSALLIMTLGASYGAQVEVSGEDITAVEAIAALIARNLDA